MTDAGLAVLRVLAGGPASVTDISRVTKICGRKTRGALRGACVAGLVTPPDIVNDDYRWHITASGRDEVERWSGF